MSALISKSNDEQQKPDHLHSPLQGHDHRRLASEMDLMHFEQHSPGVAFWHPNGMRAMRGLEEFARELHEAEGYEEVRSPQLLSRHLWEISGHWGKYRENMFLVSEGGEAQDGSGEVSMALKPMSCPGQIAIYAQRPRSYRELPFRLFEFGNVHRNESSGSLSGFLRLRNFVQDDGHVFCAPEQILEVISGFIRMVRRAYPAFGFGEPSYRIALRPEQRAGGDDLWDRAEQALRDACGALEIVPEEAPGEGAFYGPKLEVSLRDRLGRVWQCGVVQVDFVLPERFGLSYIAADGSRPQPVLIHHAVFGSLERFLAILLEHHHGLPFWMAPLQVAVLPIAKSVDGWGQEVAARLRAEGIRLAVESGGSPLQGRVRAWSEQHIPLLAIVGQREADARQVSLRPLGSRKIVVLCIDELCRRLREAKQGRALAVDLGERVG